MSLKTEFKEISPLLAKELLKSNYKNQRYLRRSVVDKYSKDMINGNWDSSNGIPIVFDNTGSLVDGQHRLNAVIKSNKNIDFLIVSGASDKAFKTIDTGIKRAGSDVLSIIGVHNSKQISSSLNYYNQIKTKKFGSGGRLNNNELIEMYNKLDYKVIQSLLKKVTATYNRNEKIVNHSALLGVCFYLCFNKLYPVNVIIYSLDSIELNNIFIKYFMKNKIKSVRLNETEIALLHYQMIIDSLKGFKRNRLPALKDINL